MNSNPKLAAKVEVISIPADERIRCSADMGNRQSCDELAVYATLYLIGDAVTGAGTECCVEHGSEAMAEALAWLAEEASRG